MKMELKEKSGGWRVEWFNPAQDGYRWRELVSRSSVVLRLSPTAEATSAIRGCICVSPYRNTSIAQGSNFQNHSTTRAERRGVAKDMGGRLGDAASIIEEGGGGVNTSPYS
jgi:hypothetical protein